MIKDAEDPQLSSDQRGIAFETAVVHWSWKPGEEEAQLERLRAAVAFDPSFGEHLQRAEDHRQKTRDEQNRAAAEREAKKERQRAEDLNWLRSHLDEIRSGKIVNALFRLTGLARQKSGDHRFSTANWRTISAELAEDIAEATRDGAIAFWRTWQPPLPHGAPENQTPGQVGIGLAGIAWELELGLNLTGLGDDEAEHALRYALFEYNGFPNWLAQLAKSHSDTVLEVMGEALAAEFDGHSGMLLQNLAYAHSSLQELLAPELEELIRDREPKNLQSLRYALSILGGILNGSTFTQIAQQRLPVIASDQSRRIEWLTAWFQSDPSPALEFIQGLSAAESRSAISQLASQLGSERLLPNRSSVRPLLELDVLRRLIPLVFQQVPTTTIADFDSTRGAVAVGPPDARFFRESIVQQLAIMRGDEPYRALIQLANAPGMESEQHKFLQLAEKQASNDCEREFDPDGIPRWERACVAAPETSDDLFRVGLRRLEALKRDIESGDFSDRELFNPSTEEFHLQKYVANRLRIEARGQYNVHREEEVDLEKRTDIRLWHRSDLVATIEVKCANKWTYAELRNSLESQLVGKYLRDRNSRHGVLLLGHLGGKNSWRGPDGKELSIEDLTIALNNEAEQIAASNSQVSSLAVRGIDFRSPESPAGPRSRKV